MPRRKRRAPLTRDGDHLTVKFDADALDTTLPAVPPQPFLQALRRVDAVTLAVDLGPRFGTYRSSTQTIDTTARVLLELLPPATETAATPPPAPAAPAHRRRRSLPPADLPAFGQPASAIRTVTIDPGHGGADEGARGVQGLLEKNLTLTVARRVKGLLEGRLGLRVLLTRDDDRNVAFDDRAAVANNNKADLFISLHANASLKPGASGASILMAAFPDEARTRQELVPERVPVFGGGSRDIEMVLWNQAQIRYIDQSAVFTRTLQEQFQGRVPLDVRPTGRAPLRVLASANMPAVLVELGYLSNPEQEKQLASGEFQGDGRPGHSRRGRALSRLPRARRRSGAMTRVERDRRRGSGAGGRAAGVGAVHRAAPLVRHLARATGAATGRSRRAPAEARAEDQSAPVLRLGRRPQPDQRRARGAVRRRLRVRRPRRFSRRRSRRLPSRCCRRCLSGTRLRAVFVANGEAYVDVTGEVISAHPGGSLNELLTVYTHRRRAHREPARRQRRADSRRRQGGRHADRTRRPAPASHQKPRVGPVDCTDI